MRNKLLSKLIGGALALAVALPIIGVPVSASCPFTNIFSGLFGNNSFSYSGNGGSGSGSCNTGNSNSYNSGSGNSCGAGNIFNSGQYGGYDIQSLLDSLFGSYGYSQSSNNSNNSNNCYSGGNNCSQNGSCPIYTPPPSDACDNGNCSTQNCDGDDCETADTAGCTKYANDVLDLVNAERKKAGLNPLSLDTTLCAAADVRAVEIISKFSHTRPNGKRCFTAVSDAGGSYKTLGENIASGFKTPKSVVDAWMGSSGHRANILNPSFTKLGVGYAEGTGYNCCYWTQMFGG